MLATALIRSTLVPGDPRRPSASFRRCRYRAFGARTDISGIAPARQDPSFQNRTYDAGLGIYDYRNRSFDPATGRFLQRDPVMGGDELFNPYCFPGNNPVGRLDSMGLGDPAPVEAYIAWLTSDEGGKFSEEEMKPFLIKLRALEEAGYSFEIEAPGPFTFGATGRGDKKIIVYRKKDKTAMGAWATEQLCLGKEAREFRVAVMNPQIGIVGAIGSVLIDKPTEELDKARGLHPETAPLFGQERVAEDVYLQHVRSTVASEERAYAADKEIYEQIAYSAGTWATVKVVVGVVGGVGFFGRLLLNYGDDAARAGTAFKPTPLAESVVESGRRAVSVYREIRVPKAQLAEMAKQADITMWTKVVKSRAAREPGFVVQVVQLFDRGGAQAGTIHEVVNLDTGKVLHRDFIDIVVDGIKYMRAE